MKRWQMNRNTIKVQRLKAAVGMAILASLAVLVGAAENDRDLLLRLDFNTSSNGCFLDSSTFKQKATNYGVELCEGVEGLGVHFKGSGDNIAVDFADQTQPLAALTIEAWISPDAPAHANILCGVDAKRTLDNSSFMLRWRANWEFWLHLMTVDGEGRVLQNFRPLIERIALPKRTWTYIATTYDGETSTYYVGGKQVAQQTFLGGKKPIRPSPGGIIMGAPGELYRGGLDLVRIYRRALSGDEVRAHFEESRQFKSEVPPAATPALKSTIDGKSYADCSWFVIPLKHGSLGLSNIGQIAPASSSASGYNSINFEALNLMDMEGRTVNFYETMMGNIEIHPDGSALLDVKGTTKHGVDVHQTVAVTTQDEVRVHYKLTALKPDVPAPKIVWRQSLWPSAMRFVGYDNKGLITGSLMDLGGELTFEKLVEFNLVRSANRLVCDLGANALYRVYGTRDPKNWIYGYSYFPGEILSSTWQGWDKTNTATIDLTFKIELDTLPPRLARAKAREVTKDVPFDFSALYVPDPAKLAALPLDRESPVFMDDETASFRLNVPTNLAAKLSRPEPSGPQTGKLRGEGAPAPFVWALSQADTGKAVYTGALMQASAPIEFKAPPGGVYLLSVQALDAAGKAVATQTSEVAVVGSIAQPVCKPGAPLSDKILKKVAEVDFTAAQPGSEFFSFSGQSKVVQGEHGDYRQTLTCVQESLRSGGNSWPGRPYYANDWFGVRLATEPGKIYVVETEYPDLDWMSVSTYLIEPKDDPTPGKCRPLLRTATGVFAGGFLPHDNRLKKFQTVHFASAPWVAVVYQNAHTLGTHGRDKTPASISRVTLYEVQGELPQLDTASGSERYVGVHCEHGGVAMGSFGTDRLRGENADFNCPPNPGEFYRSMYPTIANLIKYMRYRGDNVLFYGVYRYRAASYPSRTFPPDAINSQHDVPDLVARMFAKNGLKLVLTVMPCNPAPLGRLNEFTRYDIVQGASTTIPVDADGNQFTSTPFTPASNPFHPKVRETYERLAADLGARYGRYPAVLGMSWIVGSWWEPSVSMSTIGVGKDQVEAMALQFSYDDESIRQFEQWAGVALPGKPGEADRFRKRHDWIMANAKDKFIDFRCWAMAQTQLGFKDAFRKQAPEKDYFFIDYYAGLFLSELDNRSPLDACRLFVSNPKYLHSVPGFMHMPYLPELNGSTFCEHSNMDTGRMAQVTAFLDNDALAKAWAAEGRSARYLHRQFYELSLCMQKDNPWLFAPVDESLACISYPQQGARGYLADFARIMARGTPEAITYMWSDSLLPMGHEPMHQTFAAAYRSLPHGHYGEADRKDGVVARYRDKGRDAFYVVNTNGKTITTELLTGVTGTFVDAQSGETLRIGAKPKSFTLQPYELRVYRLK